MQIALLHFWLLFQIFLCCQERLLDWSYADYPSNISLVDIYAESDHTATLLSSSMEEVLLTLCSIWNNNDSIRCYILLSSKLTFILSIFWHAVKRTKRRCWELVEWLRWAPEISPLLGQRRLLSMRRLLSYIYEKQLLKLCCHWRHLSQQVTWERLVSLFDSSIIEEVLLIRFYDCNPSVIKYVLYWQEAEVPHEPNHIFPYIWVLNRSVLCSAIQCSRIVYYTILQYRVVW